MSATKIKGYVRLGIVQIGALDPLIRLRRKLTIFSGGRDSVLLQKWCFVDLLSESRQPSDRWPACDRCLE